MYFKASYTVEGSVIISMCLIIIGICILLGFEIYKESMSYIQDVKVSDIYVVESFKQIKVGKLLLEDLTD